MSIARIVSVVFWMVFVAAVLFVSAGTLDWRGGWIFTGEFLLGSLLTVWWLARHDRALLAERMKGPFQKGQSAWDKVFMVIMMIVWYGWLVLMAFDAKRWGISHMPAWLSTVGAVLIPLSFVVILWTFRENPFAVAVVKVQKERGQKVISTGPYAIVRHPMYAGGMFYLLGTPLVLGSWIGLAALPVVMLILVLRIFIEERTLREGLEGYADYAARVRWRLVPGVW